MTLSEKRQKEILRLAREGGNELSEAISLGEEEAARHLRKIRREIADFLESCSNKDELDFFAENWSRDGNEKLIHSLIKNPHADAGTLLRIYWYSDPEFYYGDYRSAAELEEGFDRDVFATLLAIERRITQSEYKTASIPFDPKNHVTMWDQRLEFARPIPDVMYQPIVGGK
jgi:hypothetical protein